MVLITVPLFGFYAVIEIILYQKTGTEGYSYVYTMLLALNLLIYLEIKNGFQKFGNQY